jgi:integrase/recombinase XerD
LTIRAACRHWSPTDGLLLSRQIVGARNRAMILILLDTGVRWTELVNLDLEGQRLRVLHGKGNKQRVVRFGARAKEAVEDYLERFRGREPGPLFLSRHGTRMSSHSVLIFLRRLGKQAGGRR